MKSRLGTWLKNNRELRSLTLRQLSDALNKIISKSYLGQIENLQETSNPYHIYLLAKFFNEDPEYVWNLAKQDKIEKYAELLEEQFREVIDYVESGQGECYNKIRSMRRIFIKKI